MPIFTQHSQKETNVVDTPKVNGSSGKECKATGMLYELVDWEVEPQEASGNDEKGKAMEAPVNDISGLLPGVTTCRAVRQILSGNLSCNFVAMKCVLTVTTWCAVHGDIALQWP